MELPHPGEHALVVSGASRALRRQLRPVVWVALEEVALDAVADDGRWVARTSARTVAERLGLDPGTAAAALRVLRQRGLLGLEREHGAAGRFGLSAYLLGPLPGLTVVSPCVGEPLVVSPRWGHPLRGDSAGVDIDGGPPAAQGGASETDGASTRRPRPGRPRRASSQGAFDLETSP